MYKESIVSLTTEVEELLREGVKINNANVADSLLYADEQTIRMLAWSNKVLEKSMELMTLQAKYIEDIDKNVTKLCGRL